MLTACRRNLSQDIYRFLAQIHWQSPQTQQGFYDFLGSTIPAKAEHLVPGSSALVDPSFYEGVLQAGALFRDDVRISWMRFAQVFYDNALHLKYTGLDSSKYRYELAIVYYASGEETGLKAAASTLTKLVALVDEGNEIMIHNFTEPPWPMKVQRFSLPADAIHNGSLVLSCSQPKGLGGSGWACNICEVWLNVLE